MRILHVLDHCLPLHSGYTFRTRAIVKAQLARGWEVACLTGAAPRGRRARSAKWSTASPSTARRSPSPRPAPLGEWREIRALSRPARPAGRASGSPTSSTPIRRCSTALAALPVARRRGLPLVYEIRAFWEDAAVGNGTGREGSARYRLTRLLETYAARRADAVAVICEGLRQDLIRRGIAPDKIIVSPNGVDMDLFGSPPARRRRLRAQPRAGGCRHGRLHRLLLRL